MKRAKIMFVSLAILTTVGTALAFKVQKFGGNLFCTSVSQGTCTANKTYTADKDLGTIDLYCSTTSTGCVNISTTKHVFEDAR